MNAETNNAEIARLAQQLVTRASAAGSARAGAAGGARARPAGRARARAAGQARGKGSRLAATGVCRPRTAHTPGAQEA